MSATRYETDDEPAAVSPWLPVALYVAAVGIFTAVAALWYGIDWDLTALGLLVLLAWTLWLHLDRANVHDWAAMAADDADRSARAYDTIREHHNDLLSRFEALCDHLELEVDINDVAADWAEQEGEHVPDQAAAQWDMGAGPVEAHGATRWEPESPPTVPQPVTDTTAAVVAQRHRRWDDDAAALDTRVDDVEVAHAVALLEHRMWAWRRGVAA